MLEMTIDAVQILTIAPLHEDDEPTDFDLFCTALGPPSAAEQAADAAYAAQRNNEDGQDTLWLNLPYDGVK